MKVMMKRYEKEAVDYAKSKFSKGDQWDNHIIAKDAFLEGYKKCMEQVNATVDYSINYQGLEQVEVDFPDGSHQLVGK